MRRPAPWLVGALGDLLLVAGIVVFTLADASGLGWTSYTPLDADAFTSSLSLTFSDGAVLSTRQQTLGASFAVAGLLVLVGLGGWLLGRRSGRSAPSAGRPRRVALRRVAGRECHPERMDVIRNLCVRNSLTCTHDTSSPRW